LAFARPSLILANYFSPLSKALYARALNQCMTAQKNFDKDLKSLRHDPSSNLENDLNIFFNMALYF